MNNKPSQTNIFEDNLIKYCDQCQTGVATFRWENHLRDFHSDAQAVKPETQNIQRRRAPLKITPIMIQSYDRRTPQPCNDEQTYESDDDNWYNQITSKINVRAIGNSWWKCFKLSLLITILILLLVGLVYAICQFLIWFLPSLSYYLGKLVAFLSICVQDVLKVIYSLKYSSAHGYIDHISTINRGYKYQDVPHHTHHDVPHHTHHSDYTYPKQTPYEQTQKYNIQTDPSNSINKPTYSYANRYETQVNGYAQDAEQISLKSKQRQYSLSMNRDEFIQELKAYLEKFVDYILSTDQTYWNRQFVISTATDAIKMFDFQKFINNITEQENYSQTLLTIKRRIDQCYTDILSAIKAHDYKDDAEQMEMYFRTIQLCNLFA